jgi:hypothetical protein
LLIQPVETKHLSNSEHKLKVCMFPGGLTCINRTPAYSEHKSMNVPRRFGLDRFHCIAYRSNLRLMFSVGVLLPIFHIMFYSKVNFLFKLHLNGLQLNISIKAIYFQNIVRKKRLIDSICNTVKSV